MGKTSESLQILVAEDDEPLLTCYLDFLEFLGHKVFPARNGMEAIEIFGQRRQSLDLLITDFCMPSVDDGLSLIQHVRKHDKNLPIIAITSSVDRDTIINIAHSDIQVFAKPIDFTEMKWHIYRTVTAALSSSTCDDGTTTRPEPD